MSYYLSRIGSKLSPTLKKTLVKSFILSRLDYCNALYSGINQVTLNKLQTVLNASARFALGIFDPYRRFHSSNELLSELHFLPMKYRIQYKIALLSYKCVSGIAPSYLKDLVMFQDNSYSHYNLRANNDTLRFHVPRAPHYKKSENAFYYSAPQVWNSLPFDVRDAHSLQEFKTRLKTHLYRCAFL